MWEERERGDGQGESDFAKRAYARALLSLAPLRVTLHIFSFLSSAAMDPAAAASPLSVLAAEKERLENAVSKLKDSNAELKAALAAADPADAGELRAALNENLPIIARYIARAAALGEEIDRCKRAAGVGAGCAPGAGGTSEPERVEAAAAGGQQAGGAGTANPAAAAAAQQQPGPPGAADGVWL